MQNTTRGPDRSRSSLDDRATAAEGRQAHQSSSHARVRRVADRGRAGVPRPRPAGQRRRVDGREHEGVDQATEEYFERGGSGTYVQPVQTSHLTGKPTITIATPLFDPEGQRIGVVAASLNLERLDRIVLPATGLGESGETLRRRSEPRPALVLPRLAGEAPSSTGIDRALAGNDGQGLYERLTGAYR